jgi:hypothetical protein
MAFIFQYGSNLSTERLNHADRLRGDACVVGNAVTQDDYEFAFDIWSIADGGRAAADIVAGCGRKIWGVIYDIPELLIRRETAKPRKSLDTIESEGINYQRVSIKLDWPDDRPVAEPVITYVGLARRSGIQTTWKYVQYILAGLDEHKLPDEYASYVKSRILLNNPDLREVIAQHGVIPLK